MRGYIHVTFDYLYYSAAAKEDWRYSDEIRKFERTPQNGKRVDVWTCPNPSESDI